jgi:hypothetical protein
MRPAGIQDESSEHDHQKEHSSSSAETGNITHVITGGDLLSRWTRSNAMTGEPLSDAIVEKLTDLHKRMSLAVVSCGKCIRAAESQCCIRELSDKMDTLVFWTGCVGQFISNNKHDDDKVDLLDSMNGLLVHVAVEIWDVRLTLNIKYGEFDESEWHPPMYNPDAVYEESA